MNFLLFALGHLLAVYFPGQTFIGMANLSVKQGFKATIPFILGVGLGNLIFVSIAIFGLTEVIFQNRIISIIFYFLSGAYLFYFGFKLLTEKQKIEGIKIKPSKAFISGFFIEIANPKSILFTVSLVAIVIKPESSFIFKLFILFWLCAVGAIYELSIIWLFSILRNKLLNYLKSLNKVFALLIFIFSVKLILMGFKLI